MKRIIILLLTVCCILAGCNSNDITGDVDVGDINVGNIDPGDIDVGEIDTGIYVKSELKDIYSIEWRFESESGIHTEMADKAMETDVFILLTTEIVNKAEQEGEDIDFSVVAKNKDGEAIAEQDLTYKYGTKRMELIIKQDGSIKNA